jgi:hypothetical protein
MFANVHGPRAAAILAAWLVFAGSAHAANRRIFSYDPADAATREAAGQLTFEFNQKLLSTTVLRVRSTEESATADLKPAPPEAVGRGGVSRFVGVQARDRDLYQILAADDGPAMISAFCPGARRAWMAFGRLRANQDLRVYVLGDYPGGAKLCQSLKFTYHGEWRLPPGPLMNPDTLPVDRRPF